MTQIFNLRSVAVSNISQIVYSNLELFFLPDILFAPDFRRYLQKRDLKNNRTIPSR